MKTQVIASILIYCFIFQIPFMNTGCTSFYPAAGDNNLNHYIEYEGDILLKLKDGTEIEVPHNGIFYVEQDKIDSSKIVEYNADFYKQYWMKEHKRITINLSKSPKINSDTTNNFYFVMGDNEVSRQIYDNDIAEIQIQKSDNTKTALLVIGGVCLIIIAGVAAIGAAGIGAGFSLGDKGI